ncbi:ribonuclease H-like domain-containing protein [Tanacetum coccineum]
MVPTNNINYNGVTGMSRMIGMCNIKTQQNNRILPNALSTMTLEDPSWNMDTDVSSHLNFHSSNLSTVYNNYLYPSVRVGDGKTILVTNTGHSILPTLSRPLYLYNVLVTPNIIKNLISLHQFTRDNKCSVEFDEFGFSVKDFLTRHILLRCDSSGDLYPVTKPSPPPSALLSVSHATWHQRLGHPGAEVLRSLVSRNSISCNKEKSSHICHACQLGKHVKLPFVSSHTRVSSCFEVYHSVIVTSPKLKRLDTPYLARPIRRIGLDSLECALRSQSISDIIPNLYVLLYLRIVIFMDTAYGSRVIRRIGNWSNAFSCEVQALIRHISFAGYGVLVRKSAIFKCLRVSSKLCAF